MLHRAYTDPGPLSADTNLVIPSGASGRAIAQALTQAGVSADERLVQLSIRLFADKTPLRAGEYAFPAGISLRDAIGKLQSGEVVVRRVTFAEGLSTREILATLSRAEGLRGPVPEASEFSEGELLPETYHYSLGDSRADIVARMKSAMDAAVERLWADRDKDLPLKTPQEAVVLASIIERETAVPEERARVASVFINRLNRGMRLQSIPLSSLEWEQRMGHSPAACSVDTLRLTTHTTPIPGTGCRLRPSPIRDSKVLRPRSSPQRRNTSILLRMVQGGTPLPAHWLNTTATLENGARFSVGPNNRL